MLFCDEILFCVLKVQILDNRCFSCVNTE